MSVDALIARPDCATRTPSGLPTSQPINRLRGSKSCQPADPKPSSRVGGRDHTEHSRVRHCGPANHSDQGATDATRRTIRARHPGRRFCERRNPQGRYQHRRAEALTNRQATKTPDQCLPAAWEDATTSYIRGSSAASYTDGAVGVQREAKTKARHPGRHLYEGCNPQGKDLTPPARIFALLATNEDAISTCEQQAMFDDTTPVRNTITGSRTRQTTPRRSRKSSG
jgi:hypothetical protein